MSDGKLVFNTKLDNSNLEKDLANAKKKISKAMEDISKYENAKLPLTKQVEEYDQQLDSARYKLEQMRKEMETALVATSTTGEAPVDINEYLEWYDKIPQLQKDLQAQESEVAKIEGEWKKASDAIENYDSKIKAAVGEMEFRRSQAAYLSDQIKQQQAAMEAEQRAQQAAMEAYKNSFTVSDSGIVDLRNQLAELNAEKKKAESVGIGVGFAEYDEIIQKIAIINAELREYQSNLLKAKETETGNEGGSGNATEMPTPSLPYEYKSDVMQQAFEKAAASAEKFKKKVLSIGKSVLVFSAIRSGMKAVVDYTKKLLSTNDEYKAQLAQLKGALMTAFQPIYNFILPGVLAVLRVLTSIVQVVAKVISGLFGTTAAASAEAAKNLNDEADAIDGVGGAAEKAQKSMANFDEINTMGNEESSGGGGGGSSGISADFSAFNTDEYKKTIDEFTVYLSGALLAIGAILAFSGVKVPLGLALMAAGAIGMVSVVKTNWGGMTDDLRKTISTVLGVLGGAMLVIGAILAFSGVSVVKGVLLMALGLAAVGGAAAVNWNSIVTALQGPIGGIVALVSGALLVIGIILVCSGVGIPLGIALILVGAAGLVTVTAINWNAIQQKVSSVWENIKQWFNSKVKPKLTLAFWQEKFNNIAEALPQKIKDGINIAITLMNKFINWINEKMTLKWNDFSIGGKKIIDAGSFQLLNIPNIPMLAQGAVLPANKPFLSIVGDQKNGTNIEAPLETIKQAVSEVLAGYGGGETVIRFEGDLAQLGRILKPVIDTENKRVGGSLARGNV